jgi:hypothetical protein
MQGRRPAARNTAPTHNYIVHTFHNRRDADRSIRGLEATAKPRTLAEYERAIKMFTELHGTLPLVQISAATLASSERRYRRYQEGVTANCSTLRYPNSQSGDTNILTYRRSLQAP